MPKERFHLLLADQSLAILTSEPDAPRITEEQRRAFFLGAISPDALFYDLPLFRLSSVGGALHQWEGGALCNLLSRSLSASRNTLTSETRWWLLGLMGHFLADGFWHPIIEKISEAGCCLKERLELSKSQCHHWLESEMEGFWIPRVGPSDGYRLLLKDFSGRTRMKEQCLRCFRMTLPPLGQTDVPQVERIARCFSWQAFLLRQFSLPLWSRFRNILLQLRATRFLATLIVPEETTLLPVLSTLSNQVNADLAELYSRLFSDQWMLRSATFLATHLRSLSAQL